jgi:hypothetical protein
MLRLFSEQYRPEGNIDARATRRAIGRPHLDFWEVFLRETLQNSWDARLPDARSINFYVDGYFASAQQADLLRKKVFVEEPADLGIHDLLLGGDVPILVVTDSRTKGLQGPTRADLATNEPTHFVDLVRNIGRAQDKTIGGGTYGFGKGVLYEASACSTILVFTRTMAGGRPVSRLIGIGLGDSYNSGEHRYTGRHWWGIPGETIAAEPLTGVDAERLAAALGVDNIPAGETGTSIAIIGPVVSQDDETLESIVGKVAQAATDWAWPHMVGRGAGATINFAFKCEGQETVGPQPAIHPIYKHYVGAYRRANALLEGQRVDKTWPWEDQELKSGRTRLGALVYKHIPREQLGIHVNEGDFPVDHVALMRNPRLVVRYLDVPRNAQGLATIGVFVADPELDRTFALSEPVAHDDWASENLRTEKYARNPVRQALDRIRKTFRPVVVAASPAQGEEQFSGVVSLANALGDLLAGSAPGVDPRIAPPRAERLGAGGYGRSDGPVGAPADAPRGDGTGETSDRWTRGTGRHRSKPHASIVGSPRLTLYADHLAAVFPVRVFVPEGKAVVMSAEPRVVLEGGAAENAADRPAGAEVPQILGWSANGPPTSRDEMFTVVSPGDTDVDLWVLHPADTALSVAVHTREVIVP